MLVKCKCCGEKIDRDMAYKVSKGKNNEYYCTQKEYIHMITEKAQNKQTENEIFDMINYIFSYEVHNTVLFGEVKKMWATYSRNTMYQYLYDNRQDISLQISKKVFKDEFNKVKYFLAILQNNLKDYELPQEEPIRETSNEFMEMKHKSKTRRKCLADYKSEE